MEFNGSCLCKKVKYSIKKLPLSSDKIMACLCTDCQKVHSSTFSLDVTIPSSDFDLKEGNLKPYSMKVDSGNTLTRYFCPECGTNIYSSSESQSDIVIKGGTLEQVPSPGMYTFTDSKPSWFEVPEGIKHAPKMPEQ
eukprot:TRINITY_DN2119_c0_g1_i2.p1 TRINITY_DN2119_c0_g1~~TRINITY_DN2119_c0_g1_i2.p1  ORF type:complete len:137 (-),score=25.49 TRINITY_DN2119_c0_g1_i2:62-472(-)